MDELDKNRDSEEQDVLALYKSGKSHVTLYVICDFLTASELQSFFDANEKLSDSALKSKKSSGEPTILELDSADYVDDVDVEQHVVWMLESLHEHAKSLEKLQAEGAECKLLIEIDSPLEIAGFSLTNHILRQLADCNLHIDFVMRCGKSS